MGTFIELVNRRSINFDYQGRAEEQMSCPWQHRPMDSFLALGFLGP
jgi:hypothetical protein